MLTLPPDTPARRVALICEPCGRAKEPGLWVCWACWRAFKRQHYTTT